MKSNKEIQWAIQRLNYYAGIGWTSILVARDAVDWVDGKSNTTLGYFLETDRKNKRKKKT